MRVRRISLLAPHECDVWLTVQVSSMCASVLIGAGTAAAAAAAASVTALGGLVFLSVIGSES